MMQNTTSPGFRPSPQQMRLWAAQQDGTEFFSECVLRFAGKFDADSFRAALSRAAARHEALRTAFARQPGMKFPLQVIHENGDPQWRDLGTDASSGALAALHTAVRGQPEGARLQAGVVRMGDDLHVVLLRAPTLCLDAKSLQALAAECCTFAGATPPPEVVPDEPLQYADFAEWQHQTHEADDEEARAGREHWAQPALREPAVGRLLGQLPTPASGAFTPESVVVSLAPEVQQQVAALAGQWETSEEAILLACWQALLARLLGQSEVVLRCVFDGRTQEAVQGALGLYAQVLPIAADAEGHSFSSLVRQSAASLAAAGKQQEHYTADEAREATVVATLPAFEFVHWPTIQFPDGTTASLVQLVAHVAPFVVKLACVRRDDDLLTDLFYDPRGLSRSDAQRMARYYARLLTGAVAAPQAHPDTIDLLDDAERQRLLVTLNQTDADYRRTKCIHELFAEQVARTPQATALACGGRKWSYAETDARSNQIAHLLRRYGVTRNVAVGLYLERSGEAILGLLGSIQAGGAYLPLMVGTPAERLAFQLSQASAPVLLTEQKLLADVPEAYRGKVLCLDRDSGQINVQPTTPPEPVNTSEDLVYIIYTSGSTGSPKGVAVRHCNLVNYTTFLCRRLGVHDGQGSGLHFATVSTLAADLGNTCVFPSLVSGGCLHVIPYEMSLSGTAFGQYAAERPIDVLKITPSHLRSLLADAGGASVLPRRHLVLGGEASSWELIQQVRAAARCAILNHYGPTETTVGALTYGISDRPMASETVPIGRPIANTRVYVLDRAGKPVPFGAPGELCIGGAGVAQGYVSNPEQTAAHFVADPFHGDPGARMYKTGDRVRYTGDGDIEFLGRVDRQVKVHGFRVELGEIETVLQHHPSVRQAVVVARQDKAGATQLCAYVVPAAQTAPAADALREHLATRLPEYMVPAAFVALKGLPLTPNGKIDTRALPDPEQARAGRTRPLVPPRNAVEEQVAAIWKQVLDLEAVGVEDDFFELGGHSLLATKVLARVQSAFQVRVPLRTIFHTPTVAGLAAEVEKQRKAAEEEQMSALLSRLQGLSEAELQEALAEAAAEGNAKEGRR
jgi:amino acid adenylation domain-containing protein